LNSNAKFVFATAIAVILVAGALTLPLAFDDHMADAKKKKSYNKKHSSSNKAKKEAEIEAVGGHGGSAGAGGIISDLITSPSEYCSSPVFHL